MNVYFHTTYGPPENLYPPCTLRNIHQFEYITSDRKRTYSRAYCAIASFRENVGNNSLPVTLWFTNFFLYFLVCCILYNINNEMTYYTVLKIFDVSVLLWALLGHDTLTARPRVPQTSGEGRCRSTQGCAVPLVLTLERLAHINSTLVNWNMGGALDDTALDMHHVILHPVSTRHSHWLPGPWPCLHWPSVMPICHSHTVY